MSFSDLRQGIFAKKMANFFVPQMMEYSDSKREKIADEKFFAKRGRHIDFDNPVTFTEKLQWYKLYYGHPDLKRAVCKYEFKKYIAEKLGEGHTIPLYGVWDNVDDIDFDALPETFVLKSNSQSMGRWIKIIRKKSECDLKALKKELRGWLFSKYTSANSLKRAYYGVRPLIIAEEYMEQVDSQLYDYKFFCFGGEVFCSYVATDHFEGVLSHISFYDLDWNKLDVKYGEHEHCDVPKPKHYDEMIEYSKILSAEFPFVRVDFFDTDEKLYVAELTFYPGGGYTPYIPESFDEEMGKKFILPEKEPLGRMHRNRFRP